MQLLVSCYQQTEKISRPYINEHTAFIHHKLKCVKPGGILYPLCKPTGLDGVMQSSEASFLRHLSMSTQLKYATD